MQDDRCDPSPNIRIERLSALPDGRVAYAIRKPWGNETHRVMQPVQFLARLAALIPPPRHPLVRF
ncbi:MAG: transposase [Polyangiaceae bacterium]